MLPSEITWADRYVIQYFASRMCVHLGVNYQLDCYRELQGSFKARFEGTRPRAVKCESGQGPLFC